jgi:MFS family permease
MIEELFSKRWETAFFLFSGILINYCLRVNMSMAASEIKDDLGWTEGEKGYVLSSFFWGYAVGQIPATLIARKIGHKYTFGFAVFASSLLSMFMPAACHSSISVALLTRSLIGLASSAVFPSTYHFYPRWIPLAEKTLMISVVGAGIYMLYIYIFMNKDSQMD